jgi:hypothetical protein
MSIRYAVPAKQFRFHISRAKNVRLDHPAKYIRENGKSIGAISSLKSASSDSMTGESQTILLSSNITNKSVPFK